MALHIVRRPVKKFPVNPRVRAYGKARLDIASRINTPSDWDKLWKKATYPFPFTWGTYWKHCIEYKVDDFAAEVGFYTDILGLPVNALDPGYAMFTSPDGDFFIAIVPTPQGANSTPPDAIRIQFMVANLFATVRELERRGIMLEQWPQPCAEGSNLYIGYFRTPHGMCVDLWGLVEDQSSIFPDSSPEPSIAPESPEPHVTDQPDDDAISNPDSEVEAHTVSDEIPGEQSDDTEEEHQVEVDALIEVEYVDEDGT